VIKVLIIYEEPLTAHGGISRHCKKIMDLYRDDTNIQVSCLCKNEVKHHRNTAISKVVFDYRELKRRIAESGCDIVHAHGFMSIAASQSLRAAMQLNKKTVYTAHYHPFSTLNSPFLGKMFFYASLRRRLQKIDAVITINKDEEFFMRRYNTHRIMIPSSWCDENKRYDLSSRKKNMLLFVGNNTGRKGFGHIKMIPKEKYEIHCVTDKPDGIDAKAIVHLSISDAELDSLYEQASLVVVPSTYEAFSLVALQALEHGVPVLLSQFVRIADHLDGIEGWEVFEYGNAGDFLNKIETAMAKKVDVEKLHKRFSAQSIKALFDRVYSETMG